MNNQEAASSKRQTYRNCTLSSILLATAGASLVLTGIYFLFLRPPLLPEDIRYMDLSETQAMAVAPKLETWLTQVLRVMGGYVLAAGVLTITLALTAYRAHERGVGVGAFAGRVASIGLMAAVNFAIDSDFKWLLLAIALVWVSSLCVFWFEASWPAGSS